MTGWVRRGCVMPLWAMSFGCWRCSGCRKYVAWADAVLDVDEGRLVGVAHLECVE